MATPLRTLLCCTGLLLAAACSGTDPDADPATPAAPSVSPSPSATPAPSPSPSATPSPTAAPGPSPSPSPTPTPSPAPSPSPSPPAAAITYGDLSSASLGAGANLNGAVPFPADNPWNRDISNAPVDPNSANLIASIGLNTGLHPDFGEPYGIPYVVVSGAQPRVAIRYTAYGNESEPGPFPIPRDAPIEAATDHHVLVIDRDNHRLYELYRAVAQSDGSWTADSGAVFHLDSNHVRPGGQAGWTSADAAGLPIFPGLVRYEEAAAGRIPHALRFTVQRSRKAYVPPASHWASSSTDPNLPPMGMRVRLKASYVIPASFSTETRAILQALKTYGMIMADNGSNWFITGAPDSRWNNSRLNPELGSVKGSDFEVVRMDGLVTP